MTDVVARALADHFDPPKVWLPRFRGNNLVAQTITDHEWIVSGAADTGKTYGTTFRLDSEARITPSGYFAIVRRVREDFYTTVMRRWHSIIALRGGVRILGGDKPYAYEYENRARVLVLGLDRDSGVLSAEFDGIYGNQVEEWEASSWETLSSRVTGRGAMTKHPMIWGDCNPGRREHWILQRAARGVLKLLPTSHKDNPDIFDDEGRITEAGERRLQPLRDMTGVRRERYFLGKWVNAEGAVYEEFDRQTHGISRAAFAKVHIVRRFLAIDFGFTNPFVCLLIAVDGDGRMYIEREIYRSKTLLETHAVTIAGMIAGKSVEMGVADSADPEKIRWLCEHGISVGAAEKGPDSVDAGIQLVKARLTVQADKSPRLFYVEGALVERDEVLVAAHRPASTLEEFDAYMYAKGADGKPLKERPVEKDNHGLDALRYATMLIAKQGGNGEVGITSEEPESVYSRDERGYYTRDDFDPDEL